MREVERTRWIRATPAEVERLLSPATVVDWEGSFDVRAVENGTGGADGTDVEDGADSAGGADVEDGTDVENGTVVTAGGTGVEFRLRFEDRQDGYYYEQTGDGPFDHMETWLTVAPEDDGSTVTVRSAVSLGVRLPFADRVAAWKRGGELSRLLDRIDEEA